MPSNSEDRAAYSVVSEPSSADLKKKMTKISKKSNRGSIYPEYRQRLNGFEVKKVELFHEVCATDTRMQTSNGDERRQLFSGDKPFVKLIDEHNLSQF